MQIDVRISLITNYSVCCANGSYFFFFSVKLFNYLITMLTVRKNINCGIVESLERFREVVDAAKDADLRVRG